MIERFKKLVPEAAVPYRATPGSAGYDLTAVSKEWNDETLTMKYGTGLAVEIPDGYVGLLFPRSSVLRTGLVQSNCVGVIDSDYRGEIIMNFYWHATKSRPYAVGDRIGQLVIVPYAAVEWEEVEELSETARGIGGHGSTGG